MTSQDHNHLAGGDRHPPTDSPEPAPLPKDESKPADASDSTPPDAASSRNEPEPSPERPGLSLPAALLLSWIVAGLINAVVMLARIPMPSRHRWAIVGSRHAYDMGYMVGLGLLAYAVTWLYGRCAPTKRRPALVTAGIGIAALSGLLLRDDLSGLLGRLSSFGGKALWMTLISLALGAGFSAAFWLVDRFAVRRWRYVVMALAAALVVANHFVLQFNYPSIHFFLALFATSIGAVAATGLPLPRPPAWSARFLRPCLQPISIFALGTAAVSTLIVQPTATVWQQLFRTSGCVGAPLVATVLPHGDSDTRPLLQLGSPWFNDRSHVPPIPPHKPSVLPQDAIVIFMTIDAVRADVVNSGAHADLLPNLEWLRQHGVVFTNAHAPTPSTITTMASMFSGKYYSSLYWTRVGGKGRFRNAIQPHKDPTPRVTDMLTRAGVTTVHMVALYGLKQQLGALRNMKEEHFTNHDYGRASDLMGKTIERLKKDHHGRMFFYMHFIDSHAPYNLAGKQGTPFERYLREIALVDKEIGRLRTYLEQAGLAQRTVLIVAADHGEAFGEHHTHYHAVTVYEELLRVPLIIYVPGIPHRVIDQPVTLMDMGPTLLDMFGLPTPGFYMGQSLVPFLQGKNPHLTRPIAADAGRRMQALYTPDGLKAIRDLKKHTEEVYDLRRDPHERNNIIGTPRGKRAMRLLRTFFEVHRLHKKGYRAPWRQF